MTNTESTRKKRFGPPFWFRLHGWFALPIWGLLLLVCITGTLCVLSEEITWLFAPEVRAHGGGADALPLDTLVSRIAEARPEATIHAIHIEQDYLTDRVRLTNADGEIENLHVNPYSGEIQGRAQGFEFRNFMIALHGWLLFPWQENYSVGWYLVTALSIPMLGSLITGLLIFKRFYRAFYRPRLRLNKGARVFWGDLHRLAGVWSLWFIVVISASGLWFLVSGILEQNEVDIYPPVPLLEQQEVPNTADGRAPTPVTPTRAVAIARQVLAPDLRVKTIGFPDHAYDVLTITGTRPYSLLRETANAVYINPHTGEVVARHSTDDLPPLHYLSSLMTPLHFGDFGGLPVKILWFTFGCALSLMVGSGFVVWSKRSLLATRRYRLPQKSRLEILHKRKLFQLSWLIALAPLYFFFREPEPDRPPISTKQLRLERELGPWRLDLRGRHALAADNSYHADYQLILASSTIQTPRAVTLSPSEPETGQESTCLGGPRRFHCRLTLATRPGEQPALHLTLEDWAGESYSLKLPRGFDEH